jgi:hypothetical protein
VSSTSIFFVHFHIDPLDCFNFYAYSRKSQSNKSSSSSSSSALGGSLGTLGSPLPSSLAAFQNHNSNSSLRQATETHNYHLSPHSPEDLRHWMKLLLTVVEEEKSQVQYRPLFLCSIIAI